jgi:DNA repair photolyase
MSKRLHKPIKGRGALGNPDNRFESTTRERLDDGWGVLEGQENPALELIRERARSIISRNSSPDVPFDQSINPYRGCEHGCIYCFARPSHAYFGHSPGLDFETRIHYKPDAARLLERELGRKGYRCAPIALGVNTDAYQPLERRLRITQNVLEVLAGCRHPVSIVTKSALVERDLDLLKAMAMDGLVEVTLSITTLDSHLARRLEPRAPAPARRLELIRRLSAAGISTGVLMAPVIPFLNDQEMTELLQQARAAGALAAAYILLRLPHEVDELFTQWLETHLPDRAGRIMNRIRDCHGGKSYDSRFGTRMRGEGVFAELITRRFKQSVNRLGFPGLPGLECGLFRPPGRGSVQLELF